MTGSTSTTAAPLIRPEQVGPLITVPLRTASTAWAISTVVETGSPTMRFPIVLDDPSSGWTAEAAPITPSDGSYDELVVTPKKLTSLVKVSNELIQDSIQNASALTVLSDGIVRDLARKCDASYFGSHVANSPNGLGELANVHTVPNVDGFATLDSFIDAITAAQSVGAKLTAFVANFATVNKLMKIKEFTGASTSAEPLLSSTDGDVTTPLGSSIFGVPLFALPAGALANNVVYGIDRSKAFVVLRSGTSIEVDRSIYFDSDCSAIRSVLRVAWAWPHPQAVIRIHYDGS